MRPRPRPRPCARRRRRRRQPTSADARRRAGRFPRLGHRHPSRHHHHVVRDPLRRRGARLVAGTRAHHAHTGRAQGPTAASSGACGQHRRRQTTRRRFPSRGRSRHLHRQTVLTGHGATRAPAPARPLDAVDPLTWQGTRPDARPRGNQGGQPDVPAYGSLRWFVGGGSACSRSAAACMARRVLRAAPTRPSGSLLPRGKLEVTLV